MAANEELSNYDVREDLVQLFKLDGDGALLLRKERLGDANGQSAL